jgi:3-dehydroquinate synthase
MAKSEFFHEININLPTHEYKIHIGKACLSNVDLLNGYLAGTQVLIVTNTTVAPLYLLEIQRAFSSIQCDVVVLPDGEVYKNQHSLNQIFDTLITHHHHRDTTLFALGGGVIGDITGFAASTYHRGVRFIQLPTTLLAQVDASVGGKTAINHPLGKNMIGSFYQPHAVIMDVNTLQSLPEREFRAGLAEIIKYGLLESRAFFKRVHDDLQQNLLSNPPLLADLVAHCCEIKAKIVQEDERELGKRALLNLGHTFAHALEAYTKYERWLHGEAVGIGLYCAALLSQRMGYLSEIDLHSLDKLLQLAQLPRRIPKDINLDKLMQLMFHDKKILQNKLRFVLLRAPGDCFVESKVSHEELHQSLISAQEGE